MKIELNEVAMVALVFAVFSAIVIAERRGSQPLAESSDTNSRTWLFPMGLVIWLAASAALAGSGLIQHETRWMMPVMLPAFIGAAALALTGIGRRIAKSTPWFAIIGFHSFRIVIELIFHSLYLEGRLPIQATYHGLNFDILTGISACVLGFWVVITRPSSTVLIAWNTAGLVLVVTIVVVASLSMPSPLRQFTNEPSTILLSTFPFIWVPTFLAPVALAGHLVIYRKFMSECRSMHR